MAGEVEFKGKGQALRLGIQQELGGGPLTIFGAAAQKHDMSIREVAAGVLTLRRKDNRLLPGDWPFSTGVLSWR